MKNKKEKLKNATMQNIHRKIFATQLVLILSLALFLGVAGTLINIKFETIKRDQNLQNIAETIAQSTYVVRIPMSHNVDSLNVAAAAAVAFWELRDKNK